jgi:hypothetical protein
MKKILIISSLVLIISLNVRAESRVNIINTGDIEESKEKVTVMNERNPIGVFFSNKTFFIKPVKIICKDGTAGGQAFATIDITTNSGNPKFIISGLKNMSINTYKKIEAVQGYFQFRGDPKSQKFFNIEFEGINYKLLRTYKRNKAKNGEETIEEEMFVYSIITKKNGETLKQEFQYSINFPNPGKDPIVWIGDLDNDKKLDLVLDYNDFAWGSRGLFLSSYAQGNEIIHKVDISTNWSEP